MLKFSLDTDQLQKVFGIQDKNLKLLEELLNVEISARGDQVIVVGDKKHEQKVKKVLTSYASLIEKGYKADAGDIDTFWRVLESDPEVDMVKYFSSNGVRLSNRRSIRPKSKNQNRYIDAIKSSDIVISIGPAGTGKTYLAMAMALNHLQCNFVKRIVLCRPALEAGEKLGFLPGDLVEKVNPYLRPLYDALYDLTNPEQAQRLIEQEILEIAPLAFMRGRTLANSFIILDEAQNTTSDQMKMFLTRIGIGSKAVITGDITQIDLPETVISGLVETQEIFRDIDEIEFVYFDEGDVVRHKLVKKIINAYKKSGMNKKNLRK